MAKLPGKFNTKDVENRMGVFKAIDQGDYTAKFTKAERKPTNETKDNFTQAQIAREEKGCCFLHTLTAEITEGKYKGRVVFANLNLEHVKESTVEMAEAELATICEAVGKVGIEDTAELLGIPFTISLKVSKATTKYPEGNKIAGYTRLKGALQPTLGSANAAPKETVQQEEEVKAAPKPKVSFGSKK